MKSPVVKRSIVVAGHKTSVSLEEAFWNSMKEISASRDMTLSDLVSEIDQGRKQGNLSSAITPVRARLLSQPSVWRVDIVHRSAVGAIGADAALTFDSPRSVMTRRASAACSRPLWPSLN